MDYYNDAKCAAEPMQSQLIGAGQYIPPTDRQRLQEKKRVLEVELARVNAAITVLDQHPDLENFMKVLQAGLR
jgi:hypothetical protein